MAKELHKQLLEGSNTGGPCPPFAIINPDDKRVTVNEKGERLI